MFFEKMQTRKNDGFTLVELIVVIAILAILAGIAVPAYSGYIEKANVAADEQLLHAVNIAFASAAAEHVGVANRAELSYGSSNGGVTVSGVSSVNGAAPSAEFTADFNSYWSENVNSAFKTVARLKFNSVTHMFEIFSTVTQQAAVDAYNKSNLAGKTDELAGSVDNLANMLADRIGTDGVKELYLDKGFMTEEDYNSFMSKYNLTEDSSDTEIANATVMYVADKLSSDDPQSILKKISTGSIENNYNGVGTIPAASLMYGLMTGFVNSEYNTNEYELNENPTGVTTVINDFNAVYKTQEFQNYFKNSDVNKKGGSADLSAFLGAMTVVNGYEGDFDLTDENLFVSEDTTGLLESILGKQS